ncbi:MAG TPA: OmpA family protein [Nitrospira sp.]|nr:OmpA family protein [Nitrospira sp.]
MKIQRIGLQVGAVMISLGMAVLAVGCAEKRIGSTSGGESGAASRQGGAGGGVESIKQDELASVEQPLSEADLPSRQGTRGESQPGMAGAGSGSSSSAGAGSSVAADGRGLGDIFFDFDQYAVRKDAVSVLEGNSKWLRNQAGKSVVIEGHCDERGTLAYNLVLGEKRARTAKKYLENLGVPASRMQITSYGEVRPFCRDHNEGCWQQNRRAHFVVQ